MALKKALWVIPVGNYGGVARHVVDIATAGLPGYELHILTPPGALAEALHSKEVKLHVNNGFGVEAGFKSSVRVLEQVIKEIQPGIVHAHLAYADIISTVVILKLKMQRRLGSRKVGIPLLATTEHGIAADSTTYNARKGRGQVMKLAHCLRLAVTDIKIAVSHSTAEQMRIQWRARNVTVIYNGIDAVLTASLDGTKQVPVTPELKILSLSRLAPEKNIDVLIDAFAQVSQQPVTATLEIAGEGAEETALKAKVQELGLNSKVSFLGFANAAEAMARNDVLVQLSEWENLSYTLLDAKLAGMAVIATAVGGNSEILSSEELVDSMTVNNRDRVVSEVSRKLLQYAQARREYDETFSWMSVEEMVDQIMKKYRESEHSG